MVLVARAETSDVSAGGTFHPRIEIGGFSRSGLSRKPRPRAFTAMEIPFGIPCLSPPSQANLRFSGQNAGISELFGKIGCI
jgi:hypothetical protein